MPGLAIRGPAAEEAVSLYERYERRVYNVCYRVLGYEEGAARATGEAFLAMLRGADPFAAAHAACRRRIEGPSVLREARRSGIRVANLTLSVDEREALALRELEGLSHDDIAEAMETGGEAVAELICDAWIRLRDSLSRPGPSTFRRADCERAQPLIALEVDGGLDPDSNEAGWLGEHLMRCRVCRLGRDAMQGAAERYRAWRPMAAGPKLFRETMEGAAELAGADWSRAIARHEAQRVAVRSHRLRDVARIGVLLCLLGLVGLAGVSLESGREDSGAPAPAAEDAGREPPASSTPTAPRAAAEEPGPQPRASRPRASRPRASRGSGSPGSASAPGPGPRGKTGRRAAKKEGGPEPSRSRRSVSRPERRSPERAERRGRARDGRPPAAPNPAPQRPQSRPQAEIERKPDRGGEEAVLPELAPAPAPPPAQP